MKGAKREPRANIIDRRMPLLLAGMVLLFVTLTLRLFYIQIIQHQHLTTLALKQQERTIQIQPARGNIYDRNGQPLALNRQVTSFFAVPSAVTQPAQTARVLSSLLGMSSRRLLRRFKSRKAFVWIKRKVSDDVAARVKKLKLAGIKSLKETKRVYPEGSLASHVLGFVGLDNQGLAGIELAYDRMIRGGEGWIRINRDAKGRQVPASARVYKAPEPGKDIYLTIDKVVQHIAEEALDQGMEKCQAKHGSVVVVKPSTGEILAMANKPDFDPNHFNQYSLAARRNRAITDVYEPGSTFKIITAAAALEEGVLSENAIIDCGEGKGVFHGTVIRDHEPHGKLTFRDVIVYSSNVGAVKIGMRLGGDKLYNYVRHFGFGKPTGIEMPGEAEGLLQPPRAWKTWKAITTPFGQGVAVTTLQMAMAVAAVANNGRLMRPRLVEEIRGSDGHVVLNVKPESRRQVISAATAGKLRSFLCDVVIRGTGKDAAIPHYQVAGKTGTAQKPKKHGYGYDPVHHVGSFIGFFPAGQPQVLVSVVIDSPKTVQWGGLVAGPIFRHIGEQVVAYLGIPPGPEKVVTLASNRDALSGEDVSGLKAVPDCRFQSLGVSKKLLSGKGFKTTTLGKGRQVIRQRPAAGALINPCSPVILYLGKDQQDIGKAETFKQLVMPDLDGQSMRNAIQIMAAYGLKAKVLGSGMVESQKPQAYAKVSLDEPCIINCQDPEKVE